MNLESGVPGAQSMYSHEARNAGSAASYIHLKEIPMAFAAIKFFVQASARV